MPNPASPPAAPPASSGRKAFPLRLDPALHDAVQRAASTNLRSTNAEIEILLREALARRGIRLAPTNPPKRGRATTSN
jgi:hypothetical protein